MISKSILSTAVFAAGLSLASAASSAVVAFGEDVGSDVVFTYSGSIDTTGLTLGSGSSQSFGWVGTQSGTDRFYAMNGYVRWTGAVTVETFGVALNTSGVATGDSFGYEQNIVWLDPNYVSGSAINGTLTFANTTLATMGFSVGQSFVATLPNDTITVNIGPVPAVPLPAGLPLLLVGLGAFGYLSERKKPA